jgi:SpoVK/Ycf46/Vps4 family AAA+-type ATPase
VFLRILDYYSGILFLTTNRAGALDEAFKSRIHYKVYYPPLTEQQTIEIWQVNIQRLKSIEEEQNQAGLTRLLEIPENDILRFAAAQYRRFDRNRKEIVQWNGRQIRNAFQVARSLAYADAAAGEQLFSSNFGQRLQASTRSFSMHKHSLFI